MAQVIQTRSPRCKPRYLLRYQPSHAWPRRPVDVRSLADEMLREMAFVYQATRTVRESMVREELSAPSLC